MNRTLSLLAICALALSSCVTRGQLERFPTGRVIDLTYAFDEDTIYWPTEAGFRLEQGAAGFTEAGYYYEANSFSAAEHGGTHIDAPIHFARGHWAVDDIPLDLLMGLGALVDVSRKCAGDRDYQVTVQDLRSWEMANGRIPERAILLLFTGFGRFWPDRERYMGTSERGPEAVALLHFPGLHPDAARWLVDERGIAVIGIDTPSIDHGQSTHFESHQILSEAQIPALENLAHLDELPRKNFHVIALPMKIRGGSGGPVRVAAIVPR